MPPPAIINIASGKTSVDTKTRLRGRAIVKAGKGTATRTVGLLGNIFSYAFDCGFVDMSPLRGVKKYSDKKGKRYLRTQELVALGQALADGASLGSNPQVFAVLKLLILTGARKGEIEALRWDAVDFIGGYLRLAVSKTGQKAIPLNGGVLEILNAVPKLEGSPFVFPAHRSDGYYEGIPKVWRIIREVAGLENVRMHDLRHSFASIAVSGSASLPIIGAPLGHKDSATTQRYAHLHDDPLKAAAEAVGDKISAILKN